MVFYLTKYHHQLHILEHANWVGESSLSLISEKFRIIFKTNQKLYTNWNALKICSNKLNCVNFELNKLSLEYSMYKWVGLCWVDKKGENLPTLTRIYYNGASIYGPR